MEKLLKMSDGKIYDFGFLFKEWKSLIGSIDNNQNFKIKERRMKNAISLLEKIIKKVGGENNLIIISNKEEGVNFIYEKINGSILKDFLIDERECYILSIYLCEAITFNLDAFSNVIYVLEKIIKNVFEDCGISTITRKSAYNNLTGSCSTNLIEQLNDNDKFMKILEKYSFIGFLRYTHGKTMGEKKGQNIRTSMKKNTYDLYDINFRVNLIFIAMFILSLINIPRRCYFNFKHKQDIVLPEINIDFTSISSECFNGLLKDIDNQNISLTYENISNIQYYIFENHISCNLIELRNKMNILIKKEVKSIEIDDKAFFEQNIKPYLKDNNISEMIDIYKNFYKGEYLYEESIIEYIKHTAGSMGKVYHFKDEEEKKKYLYMMLLYRYVTKYIKSEKLDESELILVLNERGRNLNSEDRNKIMSALLNGFAGCFYNCLILNTVINKAIGEYLNKRNKSAEEKKEVEYIRFFNNKMEIFNQIRHGDFARNEIEYFGFICFVISVMLFFI